MKERLCFILFCWVVFQCLFAMADEHEPLKFSDISECEYVPPGVCKTIPNYHTVNIPKTSKAYLRLVDTTCHDGAYVTLNWVGNREGQCHDTLHPHQQHFSVVHLTPSYISPKKSGPVGLNAGTYELVVRGDRGGIGCDPCSYTVRLDYIDDHPDDTEPNNDWEHLQPMEIFKETSGHLGYSVDGCEWDYADGYRFYAKAGQKYAITYKFHTIFLDNESYDNDVDFFWDRMKYHFPRFTLYNKDYSVVGSWQLDRDDMNMEGRFTFRCNVSGECKLILNTDIVYANTAPGSYPWQQNLTQYEYTLRLGHVFELDMDGDGVPYSNDACEDTAPGDEVDSFGCSAKQNMAQIAELYTELPIDGYQEYGPTSLRNGPYVNFTQSIYGLNDRAKYLQIIFPGMREGTKIELESDERGGVVCAAYQDFLLKWLEALRESTIFLDKTKERRYSDLFSNVDYGPAEACAGTHKATVIFPRGKGWSWASGDGKILDPWFCQRPVHYESLYWAVTFFGSNDLTGANANRYPNTGAGPGVYHQVDNYEQIRNEFKNLYDKFREFLTLSCPIAPCIRCLDNGHRLGYCGGEFVEEITEGVLMKIPQDDTDYDNLWAFFLPQDKYRLEMVGKGQDTFELQVGMKVSKGFFEYGTNGIKYGETASLTIDPNNPGSPLNLPDGTKVTPSFEAAPVYNTRYVDKDDPSCGSNIPCYSSVQMAIEGAAGAGADGSTIKVKRGTYDELLTLDAAIELLIQGGWDASFSTQTTDTTVIKAPKANKGSLRLQMLRIKP